MKVALALLLLVGLTALVVAAIPTQPNDSTQPTEGPEWFPWWLTSILSVLFPFLSQYVLSKLPGPVKQLVSWAVAAGITIVVGVFVLGIRNPLDIIRNLAILIAGIQAVYQWITKPIAKEMARSGSTGLFVGKLAGV